MPLSAARLALLESLFDAALGIPADSRDEFISLSASHDPILESELRALLEAHALSDSAFASPVRGERDLAERYVGARLGAYEIGAHIGSGGMGTVHSAVRADDQYRARVAVKFLRRSAESAVAIRRFRAERQILASLQHPNIATLLDGGVTPDGLPYFVMEHIDGEPITLWCDARSLDVPARLALFLQVCSAVSAAHQKLVVHRDLKPGNILVTTDGTVKLLDFGIAKLMRDDLGLAETATQVGQRAFTPEYASPEQVRGSAVDTTSDVYALGVVLFELLVGQRPFDLQGKSMVEIERIVGEQQAPRPGAVLSPDRHRVLGERNAARARQRIEGDLDAIVLMALRKEPSRRYVSVGALARDVTQHLAQQPVQARPDSAGYRIGKFVRRRKLETAAAVIACASLVGGTAAAMVQARRADTARVQAIGAQSRAEEVTNFLMTMLNSSNPESFGKDVTMRTVLDSASLRADSMRVEPELEAEIRAVMGNAYLALGEVDVAERQFQLDLAARKRHAPAGDYLTAITYSKLALVEETRGDLAKSDSLLQLAEWLYTRYPHVDRREESTALENRGRLLYMLGRVPEAVVQFRKSLALSEQFFATDDSSNAPTYINLAVVSGAAGQLAAADTFSLKGIEAARRAHGNDHPVMANALSVRAGALEALGRLDEAAATFRAAMDVKRRILGPEHVSYATTAANYSELLLQMKRYRDAATVAREVVALRGKPLEDTNLPLQSAMIYLGRALAQLDSTKAGIALIRDARGMRRRSLPVDHWLQAAADASLGEVLTAGGSFAEAESLLLGAEKALREGRGEENEQTQLARTRLVTLYQRWGKPAEATAWQAKIAAPTQG
ncbi:MAG: serine/threonine protein kinase [Gemmatimonadaceae bacterium]|nr:serine/threonine protein kinase [Gemmatimonadaceae bacterium]